MMHLAEYRKRPALLADWLPWAGLVAPGVVLNKDGAFQRTARFRGPDLDSATQGELMATSARLNNALRRLGSGWALFVEAERRVFSDPWSVAFFRQMLGDPNTYARVAERGGRFAGYCMARVLSPECELENIAVVPEARRAGVARTLLVDLLETCALRGVLRVALEVRASNDAAQALYREYGFRLAGFRRGYYRQPLEDGILMVRQT